ncbi:hypothetical protein [Frankia sp. Cas4]|uniref:hypothetical protein n=1 Tax=Frankia sp. Cas4 TaxID=3073927 RepID=UPI002AD3E1FC|nr:hypothetical protein [Frankia sp. Cas4]
MRQVLACARAMMQGWRHEMIRTLGNSLWAYRALLAAFALAAAGWIALAVTARNSFGIQNLHATGLQAMLLLTTFNLVLGLTAVLTVGLMILVPEETAFGTLLATMPMRPVLRRLALDGAVVLFALGLSVLVSAPFIWLSVTSVTGVGSVIVVLVCWLVLAVAGVLVGLALHRAATWMICMVTRLPRTLARAVSALVVIGAVGQQTMGSQFVNGGKPALQRTLEPLAHAVIQRPLVAFAVALGIGVGSVGVWWCTALLGMGAARMGGVRLIGPYAGTLRHRPRSLPVLELVQLVRHPANLSTLMVLGGASLAAVASSAVRDALLWPLGAGLLLSVGSVLFVGSYGATWTHHWLFRTASVRPTIWVNSKWLAAIGLWAGVLATLCIAFTATPLWNMKLVWGLVPQLLPAFAVSMLVGLVIPVSDEQPMSSMAAVTLAGVGGIGTAIAVTKISGDSTVISLAVSGVILGVALYGYGQLARWRERDLVF